MDKNKFCKKNKTFEELVVNVDLFIILVGIKGRVLILN